MKCVKCHSKSGEIELPKEWSLNQETGDGLVCPQCYSWIENWEYKHKSLIEQERDPEFSYQQDEEDFSWIDECGGFHIIK